MGANQEPLDEGGKFVRYGHLDARWREIVKLGRDALLLRRGCADVRSTDQDDRNSDRHSADKQHKTPAHDTRKSAMVVAGHRSAWENLRQDESSIEKLEATLLGDDPLWRGRL